METADNVKIQYPTEGVIRSAQLNDTVCPQNSVELAVNLHFDRIGSATTRLGMTEYADDLGGSILSFGTLQIQGGDKLLYGQVGTDVSVWDGSSWTSVRTATVSTKARFSQWLNHIYMVNGTDALQASNGGNFSAITNIVPTTPVMPVGDFIQAGFDGRVWIVNKENDAVYFSDIVQFTPPSTFTLTYDTSNYIESFSPQDGESITGLFRVPKALLVFKQNHIFRVYSATNVDPYPAYNVGTYSQESIVQGKDGVYFHHSSGFYKFSYDGQPTEISRRVSDFVKAIPRVNYEKVVGIYDGTDAIKWSVGEVTVEGVTYSNCQMRYTISTQIWTIYDYAGGKITALISFDDGTNINQISGTDTNKVSTLDTGFTDLGSDIYYEIIGRRYSFSEMYSDTKKITGLSVLSENGGGALLQSQVQKEGKNIWEDLGTISEKYVSLFPNSDTKDFNTLRTRIRGNSKGEPIRFDGIEILKISNQGLDKN